MGEVLWYGGDPRSLAWISQEVSLDNVLDLTNPSIRGQLGVSLDDLTSNDYSITHALGDFSQARYNGLLVPSARESGTSHLVSFDEFPSSNVHMRRMLGYGAGVGFMTLSSASYGSSSDVWIDSSTSSEIMRYDYEGMFGPGELGGGQSAAFVSPDIGNRSRNMYRRSGSFTTRHSANRPYSLVEAIFK